MSRWRVITWLFLAVNLGFALWVLPPAFTYGRTPGGPVLTWVVIDALLVMFWAVTRPKAQREMEWGRAGGRPDGL